MPPKRSQTRKRATRNTDEGPLAQRSRRQSTRNATLASQATAQVRTEDQTSAVPPSNVPSTTIQRLDPDLVKSLVSTVAEEVTRQITATLPALASPLGHHTPSVAPRVPELNGENHLSATSLHGVSAETLVEGAIATAHTQIAGPNIQATGTIQNGSFSYRHSPALAASKLGDIITHLTKSSLQPSSIPTYVRAWKLFTQFHSILFQTACFTLPISPATTALFIAYLFERNYASSTVNTYLSALSYSHKLAGLPDPTRVFYIIQMLKGYGKNRARLDSRLPITLPILQRLIEVSPRLGGSNYQRCQFKAMCSLAFFAFLRIGEMTTTMNSSCQPLQIHNLAFSCDSNNRVVGMKLTFHDFKHNYNQRPFTLTINRQSSCCPIQLLLEYLALRGNRGGAIFITRGGIPIAREAFALQLSEAIRLCGLDPACYKGHSFRIGAASYAAGQGMSDSKIRIMGRWKSNAFHKYVRISSMST